MVDVITYKCFPTLIHEAKLDIETHEKINMLTYIKNNGKDDDLHTMSYFKSLANKILKCSEIILKNSDYKYVGKLVKQGRISFTTYTFK